MKEIRDNLVSAFLIHIPFIFFYFFFFLVSTLLCYDECGNKLRKIQCMLLHGRKIRNPLKRVLLKLKENEQNNPYPMPPSSSVLVSKRVKRISNSFLEVGRCIIIMYYVYKFSIIFPSPYYRWIFMKVGFDNNVLCI